MTDEEREKARQLMIRASSPNADRSKKRPYEVEKYLYQFQHRQGEGGGEGKTPSFRDGWDRIFGKKRKSESNTTKE